MWDILYSAAWWVFIVLITGVVVWLSLVCGLVLLDRRKPSLTRKYDDGAYYIGAGKNATEDQAAAHIGLYFKWCLLREMVNEEEHAPIEEDESNTLKAVRSDQLEASKYLWNTATCKFCEDDLTSEGNAFTTSYYRHRYLKDLKSITGKPEMTYTESEVDFQALCTLLDKRYKEWKSSVDD